MTTEKWKTQCITKYPSHGIKLILKTFQRPQEQIFDKKCNEVGLQFKKNEQKGLIKL